MISGVIKKDCGFNRRKRWEDVAFGSFRKSEFIGIHSNIQAAASIEGKHFNNFRQGGMQCSWYTKLRHIYDENEESDFCQTFYSYPSHLLRNVVRSMKSSVMQTSCFVN